MLRKHLLNLACLTFLAIPISCFAKTTEFTMQFIKVSALSALDLQDCQPIEDASSNTNVYVITDMNGALKTITLKLKPNHGIGGGLTGQIKCIDSNTGKTVGIGIIMPVTTYDQEPSYGITAINWQISIMSIPPYSKLPNHLLATHATAEIIQ